MAIPFKYLGMYIGGNHRSMAFWSPVIDKIKSKLSTWKGKLIFMARRLCLIKLVFNSLPLFYLVFFNAPIGVCKIIRKI